MGCTRWRKLNASEYLDDNMQSVNILLDEDEFDELRSGGKNAHRPQR